MSRGDEELDPELGVSLGDLAEETQQAPNRRLEMDVSITDAGPCKKHLKITIPREEIDRQFEESLSELRRDAVMPGFRPGRAPKQLVIKRYKKEVSNQVKEKLLMSSLGQIDEDHKLDPITPPNLDIEAIELPDDGPMNFEVDLDVRPQFDLPYYKGFRLRRPIIEITEKDVDNSLTRILEEYAELVPKLDGAAEIGDHITADLRFIRQDGRLINEVKEVEFRLQPELRFQNGTATGLGAALTGARPGDVREVEAKLGSAVDDPTLRGQTVTLRVQLNDLKYMRLPETNPEFLHSIGFENLLEMRDWVRAALHRRASAEERRVIRRQIVDLLLRQAPFDLPIDLVAREEKNTTARLVDQLRRQGMTDKEFRARAAEIRANAHETTVASLKELLILFKIADAEEIKVDDADIEVELQVMAERADESIRRVRVRLEKEGGMKNLATQILENKVIDRIREYSEIEDVALPKAQPEPEVETVDYEVVALAERPMAESQPQPKVAFSRSEQSQQREPEEPVASIINVWLDEAEEPLRVGKTYRVAIDAGAAREETITSEQLAGARELEEETLLAFVVTGDDVRVSPPVQQATLHARYGMKPIYFDITPLRSGEFELLLSIFLARELILLQKMRVILHSIAEEGVHAVEP